MYVFTNMRVSRYCMQNCIVTDSTVEDVDDYTKWIMAIAAQIILWC